MITIFVQKPMMLNSVDAGRLYIIDESEGKRFELTMSDKPGYLKRVELKSDEPKEVEPFLILPSGFFEEFIKGIVEYANNEGIKPKDQTLIEGKYEATKEHLADMRKLVFKIKQ